MAPHRLNGRLRLKRIAAIGALVIVSAGLGGCANRDRMATNALPDDYRTRHPIVIAEAEHTIDVPVASGDRRLTVGARDVVRGFASDYKNSSTGTVRILLPDGSMNTAAAASVRKDIRSALVSSGIPATRIAEARYQAAAQGDAAPIRLSYTAISAKTHACGNWPSDLAATPENRNYENFGCATQSNLAAQIANPMDLIGPREMSPIDAVQRGQVISDYRGIESTASTSITFTSN